MENVMSASWVWNPNEDELPAATERCREQSGLMPQDLVGLKLEHASLMSLAVAGPKLVRAHENSKMTAPLLMNGCLLSWQERDRGPTTAAHGRGRWTREGTRGEIRQGKREWSAPEKVKIAVSVLVSGLLLS